MIGDTYEYTQEVTSSGMGNRGIKCLLCGLTSYHPNDCDAKFCGNCHRFHSDTPPLIPGDQVAIFAPGESITHYGTPRKIGTITRVLSDGLTYIVSATGLEELSINVDERRVIEWRMKFYRRHEGGQRLSVKRSSSPPTAAELADVIDPPREIPELQSWPHEPPRRLTPAIAEPEPVKPIRRRWWRLWW